VPVDDSVTRNQASGTLGAYGSEAAKLTVSERERLKALGPGRDDEATDSPDKKGIVQSESFTALP
jgi:hypothetical protein